MPLSRRLTLHLAGGAAVVSAAGYLGWRQFGAPSPADVSARPPSRGLFAANAAPPAGDQRKTPRTLGAADAKVTIAEFFSLTCTHCAAFARGTMPDIEKDLIAPGKVRFVYHDFPLDQVALTAAMVARTLPPDRYHPFVNALLANQDRWAFARGINSTEEIWKIAALAGMSRPTFDQAIADNDLRNWILQEQKTDQDRWKIDSTPSFVINGQKYSGEMTYEAFRKLIPEA
jgi:protein-disulfide isomerase